MSFELYNWTSHLVALLFVVLLCWPTFWIAKMVSKFDVHKKIDISQVVSVRLLGAGEKRASSAEIEKIVEWFNNAAFIQKREYVSPENKAHIVLKLRSGEEILIVPKETDFDVIRRGPNGLLVTYWARQGELRKFLATLL